MTRSESTMDCSEARREIPAQLYAELDPGAERALRDHIADCAACREELQAAQRVLVQLSAWSDVSRPAHIEDLRRVGARRSREQRWRTRALPIGLAAALLACLTLLFLGLEVELSEGRLVLSVGRVRPLETTGAKEPAPASGLDQLVQHELDQRTDEILVHLGEQLVSLRLEDERRSLLLLQALDQRLDQGLAQYSGLLQALAARAAREDFVTRRALEGVAALMTIEEQGPFEDR